MTNANTRPGHDTTEDTREIHPAVITWALVIGLIVAFAVTASSFKLSFTTLLDLATMAGMHDSAWVIPVVLDGPILAASILRIALSQHSDRRTVLGRRFIIAVFALAGVASMAGNAYHAVLTVTDLNAAVAAALAALAPLMVMTMGEMMSVAIRAPRRRTIETTPADTLTPADAVGTDVSRHVDKADPVDSGFTTAQPAVDEDLDNGLLKPAVWASVYLWLEHPDMSNSDIARELGIHTSTVGRHIKAWNDVQRKMAHRRSLEHTTGVQRNDDDSTGAPSSDAAVQNTEDRREFDGRRVASEDYSAVEADTLEYVGASSR
ncbi:hypothetical protein CH253_22745 [Rhodococcus sp. 06-156-3C]|uniref:DUF2637 domain-containing protein n=1 Tax=Rhodococcus sp. 06-156-3C TaxID=2022486 RepID=UPI000B9C44E2|nr:MULTISPECIES: DUF2637 domain-containing protein [unclassified Rhodococcus (in: high G+C Gram-positive bacteria)]OZD12023.1 hypothetical protein CH248_28865 [Rhodococcus sp. 06-156-4a]OZD15788.1 hypothetical protein CH253_22745 [Rhodococcus sp. 06-156-3C]OZD21172.1 hypothetical protein CH280_02975 [Rhodococcus sp. 06-156-4C]OZD32354.1 hypothetical protein CH284_20905 [Rhodococcus sp. 06-156-3]OZD36576.1 hypothetical protein CH247_03330 [Rhodococcus sp. 06-156-3b]